MMIQKNLLEKKERINKLKKFSLRNDLRFLFSRFDVSLIKSSSMCSLVVYHKVALYRVIKQIKLLKAKTVFYNNLSPDSMGWKLQENGFYFSTVESIKSRKINPLRQKLYYFVSDDTTRFNFCRRASSYSSGFQFENKSLKALSRGFDKYLKYHVDSLDVLRKRKSLLRILKSRRFLNKVYLSRLFLLTNQQKKKYRNAFFYFFRRRQKVRSLLHLFALSSLKFKYLKRQQKKVVKKLAWKLKKSKRWKRNSSLFWLRQKLSQVFYVPRHLEVNYKTLASVYLGFTDFKTVNAKIPFWLNVRKLLTFLS